MKNERNYIYMDVVFYTNIIYDEVAVLDCVNKNAAVYTLCCLLIIV